MSPEPVAAERAYQRLKSDLVSGRYRPGADLIERLIAQEFGVSVSPVRDGAQRLVGEGLLEIAPGGGYRIPVLTHVMLRDLYSWHSHLLRLVVKTPHRFSRLAGGIDVSIDDPASIARAATDLFRALAKASDHGEHRRALLSATDKLHAVRLREGRVLGNLSAELEMVTTVTVSGSIPDRIAAISAYHRRRIRRVEKISEIINS